MRSGLARARVDARFMKLPERIAAKLPSGGAEPPLTGSMEREY
jgi:hypothetical protein